MFVVRMNYQKHHCPVSAVFTHSTTSCLRLTAPDTPPIQIDAQTKKCLGNNELETHRRSGEQQCTNSSQLPETESGRQPRKANHPAATIRGAVQHGSCGDLRGAALRLRSFHADLKSKHLSARTRGRQRSPVSTESQRHFS